MASAVHWALRLRTDSCADPMRRVVPPSMRAIPFESFRDRHLGERAVVVGKGATTFEYGDLARLDTPTYFVNDSVCLERFVAPTRPCYWFAHDRGQMVWMPKLTRAIAVLPEDGKVLDGPSDPVLESAREYTLYHWRVREQDVVVRQSKEELARTRELFTDQGTIHSLLHFVWFCGVKKVSFIGCDGLEVSTRSAHLAHPETGYDARIENASNSAPWGTFSRIRKGQDRLCRKLGFEVEHLGTPPRPGLISKLLGGGA